MAAVGRRFDIDAAREEARAKKKAEQIRKIASAATLGVVVIGLAVGGWIGWTKWQDHCRLEREAAEAAQLEQDRREAEKKRIETEKREAERVRREAERKALEAQREAERKAREEKREADRRAREEARRAAEEAKRLAAKNKIVQKERKDYADKTVGAVRFVLDDHVTTQAGLDGCVELAVDERRWVELSTSAQMRQTIDFCDLLRDKSVTNEFSESNYPDKATLDRILENLAKERFTLVVQLTDAAKGRRLVIAGIDAAKGLSVPDGCREMKSGGRVTGWTVPFAYGGKTPLFVMDSRTADKLAREWNSFARKVRKDAEKLSNRDEFVAERLEKEIPDFAHAVAIELKTPPPEEKKAEPAPERKAPKATMKGSGDIRRMNGPQLRR